MPLATESTKAGPESHSISRAVEGYTDSSDHLDRTLYLSKRLHSRAMPPSNFLSLITWVPPPLPSLLD